MEACVGRSSPQGWGHWKFPLGINPFRVCHYSYYRAHRPQGWATSGQTTTERACTPSADNWTKSSLSKALPTKARPSLSPHHSLSSGSFHKTLIFIRQRADRRSRKQDNLTAVKTKTILQKVNHDEKAESYAPDEGTR